MSFETRSGKWLAIALTGSLAINLFLGGLFVGRWFSPSPLHAERGPRGERPVQALLDRMGASLDSDERALFDKAVERHRPHLMALGNELRDRRRNTVDAMRAEPFDRAALERAMAELRERNAEFQRTLHATVIDAATALPAPARQKIASANRPRGERGPR